MKENVLVLTKKQILSEEDDRSWFGRWFENIALVLGFVPVIGEVADIALICYYLYRKEYIYAALTCIALIPTVGDIIAFPIIKVLRGLKGTSKISLKSADDLAKVIPMDKMKQVRNLAKHPKVIETATQLSTMKNPLISRLGKKLSSVLQDLGGYGTAIAKNVMNPKISKPVSTAIKGFSREKSLARWMKKNGKDASQLKGFFKFWHSKYLPYRDRRMWVRWFIKTNRLLEWANLPSVEDFIQNLTTSDEFANRFSNHPLSTQLLGNTMSEDEMNEYMGTDNSEKGGSNFLLGLLGTGLGIFALKAIAQKVVD